MTWETHWNEIAERIDPMNRNTFSPHNFNTPGEKKTEFQLDSTPSISLERFTAIVISLLTPDNAKWHRLVPSNRQLLKSRNVRLYLEEVNNILWEQRRKTTANFSGQNYQTQRQLGAYGTGTLFIDGLSGAPGLRYSSIHVGQIFYRQNHQGLIDQADRMFPMTARQMLQKFGEANLPDAVKTALEGNKKDQSFKVLHCVKPRADVDPSRYDFRRMPFESYYVNFDGGDKRVMQESGYNTFPYAIGRYVQASGEVYGRSPAMQALPAIRTLQEMKKTILKQGHRVVDPVLLMHDDGILDGFNTRPGAMNSGGVNAEGRELVKVLPTGRLDIGLEMMQAEQGTVNDAFLTSLFQILEENRPEMTATEVLERTREKGILLAPTVGRQQSEFLGPLIDREVDVLAQQGLLPRKPRELEEAADEYRLIYDNPMSRAARAEEASGLQRTVQAALEVTQVTQDPAPLDHFDWDVIIPEIASIQAVPERWMRAQEDVAAIRQGRAQQAQKAQEAQAAPGVAALMSSTAKLQQAKKA